MGSLQNQTHQQWEAIIINDGSPDNTREVALALGRHDARVRYYEKTNGGLSSARNAGLQLAQGRWIQFLDADDLIEPSKLAMQVQQLSAANKLAFSYCGYWRGQALDPRVRLVGPQTACDFRFSRPVLDMALRWEWDFSIPIHTALFDGRIFRDLGVRFDHNLPNHEDWDMWVRLFAFRPAVAFTERIDAVAKDAGDQFYVEILASHGRRQTRPIGVEPT